MKEYLVDGLKKNGIIIDDQTIDNLIFYKDFLKEKNKIVNLTAITDDKEIVEKHFIDSMMIHNFIKDKTGNAIDIGTGAGFPGMVLAIANPQIHFTLVDSIGKKTKFLEELKEELDLKNVTVVNKRAEDYIKDGKRSYFDLAFSRGVSEIRILVEYVMPFVKCGGVFFAQKANYEKELENGQNALEIMKSKVINIHEMALPYAGDRRVILEIEKHGECDEKYPRKPGTAEKKPL